MFLNSSPNSPLKRSRDRSTVTEVLFTISLPSPFWILSSAMDLRHHLRPRKRERDYSSGFTPAEVEKMENLHRDLGDRVLEVYFCKKLMARFNCSAGRAGKPVLKWTEVHDWFCERHQSNTSKDPSLPNPPNKLSSIPKACATTKAQDNFKSSEENKVPDLSELEFEARSTKDCAWYDVDRFLAHRFLKSGDAEVHVRFVGFGPEEDEWVNVSKAVRERSLPLEPSECTKVKVGDVLLCFQERRYQARYYDARVEKIERRLHDLRGCRCRFSIRYDHDNAEETVGLRSLCRRRWSDS